jgi:hypothetical protein
MNPRGPHWDDRADLLAWLAQFRDVVEDLASAAEDITREEDERTLGRLAAREAILAAREMAKQMLACAMRSVGEQGGAGVLN